MNTLRRILIVNPMQLVVPLAIFAATFGICWLIRNLVFRAVHVWLRRSSSRLGLITEEALRGPTWIWILILSIHVAIQSSSLPPKWVELAPTILVDLWVVSLTLMCMRITRNLVRLYGSQVPGALPVTTLTQNLAQGVVLVLGSLVILAPFVRRLAPVLTALGVGGLAVALALQDTLSNLFAGFYVAVAGHVRLGDYIKLNSGEEGFVKDIGWRSTSLRSSNHNLVIIPNAKLAQAMVTNYYLPDPHLSSSVQVPVTFDSDPEHVERVLLEMVQQAAAEVPGLLHEPAPTVLLEPGFGDYGLLFSVNFQVADFTRQGPVRHELRKRIWKRFHEEHIEIPIPAKTLPLVTSAVSKTSDI
jgi:small-conductance mechanosensitive channel